MDWFSIGILLGLFIVLMHICGLVAAFHAIQHARTAHGAVAWALCLVVLPYLALIPYLFLGSSRFLGYVDTHRLKDLQTQEPSQSAWQAQLAQLNSHEKIVQNL